MQFILLLSRHQAPRVFGKEGKEKEEGKRSWMVRSMCNGLYKRESERGKINEEQIGNERKKYVRSIK